MHVFISAGEPSGDLHGANLIRELKKLDPTIRLSGFGGDRMAAAGCQLLYPLSKHSVMWLLHVVKQIFTFLDLLKKAQQFFRDERPDVVVVIDYPGFHWKLAQRAKAEGIPVIYFVPPQIWAWARWRVKKMRRLITHVLSALPFEHEWLTETRRVVHLHRPSVLRRARGPDARRDVSRRRAGPAGTSWSASCRDRETRK